MLKDGAENLWNIPNSAKDNHNEKSKQADTATTEKKVVTTQNAMTTLDTRTSLGIYSISAPSSAEASSKIDVIPDPSPTLSEAHLPSSTTSQKETTNKAITSPARKPILVTGIPNGNGRKMNGRWGEDDNKYDDTMPRIPITTPHSVMRNKSSSRKNDGLVQKEENHTNSITKGIL